MRFLAGDIRVGVFFPVVWERVVVGVTGSPGEGVACMAEELDDEASVWGGIHGHLAPFARGHFCIASSNLRSKTLSQINFPNSGLEVAPVLQV